MGEECITSGVIGSAWEKTATFRVICNVRLPAFFSAASASARFSVRRFLWRGLAYLNTSARLPPHSLTARGRIPAPKLNLLVVGCFLDNAFLLDNTETKDAKKEPPGGLFDTRSSSIQNLVRRKTLASMLL